MAFMNKVYGTAYQQNLAQPVQPKPEEPWSTRRVMGNIAKTSAYDSQKAQKMFDDLMYLQTDASSKYYNPYAKASNRAVDNLAGYGIDTSRIDDKFFHDNDYLLGYLSYNGQTNTPSKPGKKASNEEKAAWEYYQIKIAEDATKKVETQWQALQDELSYWANRKDRNYSDDEIISRIDWKKYGALTDLETKQRDGKPAELNRGTTFSRDAMYGVLWAARNGGSSGSIYGDMARSYNGEGTPWQFDQTTADKLNPKSENYNPYSVGSTIDDAALYFDVDKFDQGWLQQNDGMQYGQDETAKKMYQKVLAAEGVTQKAEQELAELNAWVDRKLQNAKTAEAADKILNRIDWNKYPTLDKMDQTIGKGDMPGSGDLLQLTRAVDYRYADLEKRVRDACYENAKIPMDVEYVDDLDAMTGVAPMQTTDIDSAIIKDQNKRLEDAADLFDGAGTGSEQSMGKNLWSTAFGLVKDGVSEVRDNIFGAFTELTQNTIKHSIGKTSASILNDSEFIAGFEKNVDQMNKLAARAEELRSQYGDELNTYGNGEFNPNLLDEEGRLNLSAQAGWNLLTDDEKRSLQTMLNTADNPDGSDVMDSITAVYKSYMDKHSADKPEVAEYNQVISDLDKAVAYARENEEKYNEAIADRESANEERNAVINLFQKAGATPEQLQVFADTDAVIDALRGFTEYEPTQWEGYNAYDLYAKQMALDGADHYADVLAEATEGAEKNRAEAERARWILDYSERYGVEMPDNVRNNVERYIAKLDRDYKDYEYFALLSNDDFAAGAEKGRELAYNDYYGVGELDNRTVGWFKATNLMSDYEIDTYHYLYATQGKEAAEEYYNHLADSTYGALTVRAREGAEAGAKDLADQGILGRRAADAASIILSPAAVFGSLGQMAEYGINKLMGKDAELNPNSPWLAFNQFRNASRAEIKSEIEEAYGEGTLLTTLATGLQEIIDNRGDSYANMIAFGWLTGGINNEMMQEFVGALPMGMSAAADTMAEAKEKGATDEQAWALGGVTAFCESITEAISISNINKAFASGEVTAETVKSFIKDWLTKEGISEMVGESVNDILENLADEKIMGELSNHAQMVQEYIEGGMTPEEAEVAARRDEISGVLHTALISYLSPGMDIVKVGPARLNYLRAQTRFAQQNGENVSLLDVMRRDQQSQNQVEQTEVQNEQAETTEETAPVEETAPTAETQEQTEVSSAEEAGTAVAEYEADKAVEVNPEEQKAQRIAADYQILDNAGKADAASQTASVAAVLQTEQTDASADMAKATAAKLADILGGLKFRGVNLNPTEFLKNLWLGASETNTDLNTLKVAIQNAVLGGEESAAYQQLTRAKFRKADYDAQAQRLVNTVEADQNNPAVQSEINKNIHESRIVEAEGQIIASGGQLGGSKISLAQKAQQTLDKTAKALMTMKTNLEAKQNELAAATNAADQASADLRQNPTDENKKRVIGAISKYNAAAAVVQEYEQGLAKAESDHATAEENANRLREEALTEIRQQAEQIVAQQDEQRAGRALQEQQIAQQEAEQAAAVEAVTNEVENIARNDADAYIEEQYPNATEEEKQTIRDMFNRIQNETPANPVTRDEAGQMTPEAVQRRDKFVQQISKKFGINIAVEDTTKGGVVDRQNGYYDRRNNRIVIDQGATIDDAMFFVLGHELTHVAEQSDTYRSLAGTLVRMRYGYDDAKLAADIRARKALYDERLARMHEQDNSINATPLTEEEASQEIVADIMGDLLRGDENLINRLAAEEPSTARRIIESIKSFLKKAVGMKGAWVSDAQRTVDMLEKALKDAQGSNSQAKQEYVVPKEAYTIRKSMYSDNPVVRINSYIPQEYRNALESIGMKMFNDDRGWGFRVNRGKKVTFDQISEILEKPIERNDRYSIGTESKPLVTDSEGNEVVVELPGGTVSVSPDIRYSLRSFDAAERDRVRQALYNAKDENGNKRYTKEEVDKYIYDALGVAAKIAQDRTRLDFEVTDDSKSMFKPNADYGGSIDASTLCAKRLVYQGTFDAIQHLLPNTPLMPEDLIHISDVMREMGYETPCGICYVESRRRNLDNYIAEWLKDFTGTKNDDFIPQIQDVSTTDGLENVRKNHPETYKAFMDAMNSHGKQNNPKPVQLRTEYKGEIRNLSDKQIKKYINHGGIRLQSFSDFETPHLLDMMQVIMDISSKNLTSQAYTKVPNFAWVFGDTGVKINLSLIGKGEGVDENGNLVFDDVEGMPFEEAMKLRDRYSKNVGTILVCINDKHILAAMADPRIDYIIPFHSSGWTKEDMKLMHTIAEYTDYQNYQTEKDLDTGAKTKKNGGNNIAPVGEKDDYGNGYWDFTKSGKENAQTYLDLCWKNRLVPVFSQFLDKDSEGRYSLKKDGSTDGYWKLLIDFKMYENDGDGSNGEVKGSPQTAVTPNINMNQAYRVLKDYNLERKQPGENTPPAVMKDNNSLPVATPVVQRIQEEFADREEQYKAEREERMAALGRGPATAAFMGNMTLGNAETQQEEVAPQQRRMAIDDETGETVRYSLPEGEQNAIYVKDGHKDNGETVDFIEEILNGNKRGETRTHKNLSRTQWLGLAKDGNVFGRVRLGEPRVLEKGTQDYYDSMIEGTEYDLNDRETKWFYPIIEIEDFRSDPKPIIRNGNYGQYRYSLPSDADYLAAVERGDMETAQRDVEEAAKEAGYNYRGYHGTSRDFNVFDKQYQGRNWNGDSRLGPGFYFAHDEYTAQKWTDGVRVVDAFLSMKHPLDLRGETPGDIVKAIEDWAEQRKTQYDPSFQVSYEGFLQNVERIKNYELERPSSFLSKFKYDENGKMTDGIREFLAPLGYDGIITDDEMVVFEPDQIKSADPVTYDDQGSVIPLSERFNTQQEDIRYSLPSENLLEQQIRNYLQRGGSLATKQRQFGSVTAQKSDELSEQAKTFLRENSDYVPDSNSAQINRAIDWIKNIGGYDRAMQYISTDTFDTSTKDSQAIMYAMLGMAIKQDKTTDQIAITDKLNNSRTGIAQALQVGNLFRLMTPEGRSMYLQKMLNDTQKEINKKGTNITLKFSDWIYKAVAEAKDENDFAKIQQAAAKELAEQIPSNWKDKARSIRMLSMLGNPRTHIRNIIGNMLFVPAVGMKNKLGAIGEILSRQENRTKTLAPFLNKEVKQFAREDALKIKDTLTGEAKYNEGDMVKREQKPFKGLLQAVIDFNGGLLEKEDWVFLKGHYRRALGGWMQANGYTAEQLRNDSSLLDQGRAYAIQEAQKATYRDFSKMAQTLNQVSRNGGVAGFIVDAALPFKKTPANILKRGLEYSPAGIMKSLTADLYHLKQWHDFENGKLNALPEKAISPTEFIDHLCSGLAGTAIMAMGALLANSGIVSCGLDDDDDELEKLKGNQKYSINLKDTFIAKILGEDITFTMDWAAPMSMPFFVGAAIQNQLAKGGDLDADELINAFANITEPVFNLSMLDGINTVFKTSQYDDTNTLTQIGAKIGSNYVTSYVPSVIGAIARTIDDKQRKNFVESGKGTGVLGTFRYAAEQVQNKIPGLNQQNIAVRDVWGNEETTGLAERILENFILPGYVNEYKDDPLLNEIGRVADATQDYSIVPSDPPKSFSYKNQKIVLTDKQWDAYKRDRGHTAYEMMNELITNPDYQNASVATQADMIKDVWSYADKMGRKAVIPDFDMVTSSVDSIAEEGKIDGYKNEMVKALQLGDIDAYETMVEALLEEDVKESDIRKKIQDTYINKYKEAYRTGDYETMADIQDILDDSGFDFNTDAWEEAVDKKYGI